VRPLVNFNGTAVRIFGHDPATLRHLLVLGEQPGTDPAKRVDRTIQGLNVEAREHVASRPALGGARRRLSG